MTAITRPCASAISRLPAPVSGAATSTEPAPTKMRAKVPTNSAAARRRTSCSSRSGSSLGEGGGGAGGGGVIASLSVATAGKVLSGSDDTATVERIRFAVVGIVAAVATGLVSAASSAPSDTDARALPGLPAYTACFARWLKLNRSDSASAERRAEGNEERLHRPATCK